MVLDVAYGSANDGTTVLQYPYFGRTNQLWSFDKVTQPSGKLAGGYYPDWADLPRIRDLDPNLNLIYLFAARPVGGPPGTTGAVTWGGLSNGQARRRTSRRISRMPGSGRAARLSSPSAARAMA
jgi:hypothetical protein